jgi:hypothetical protein
MFRMSLLLLSSWSKWGDEGVRKEGRKEGREGGRSFVSWGEG